MAESRCAGCATLLQPGVLRCGGCGRFRYRGLVRFLMLIAFVAAIVFAWRRWRG